MPDDVKPAHEKTQEQNKKDFPEKIEELKSENNSVTIEASNSPEPEAPVSELSPEEEKKIAAELASKKAKEKLEEMREEIRPGDTIKVYTKIKEGDKERIQAFQGIIISKKGRGISKTFTVRKIAVGNIGVERIWPLFTPVIVKIELVQKGKSRRAKLYYMRDRIGKSATFVKKA